MKNNNFKNIEKKHPQESELVTQEVYQELLEAPKSEKQTELHYYRFKFFLILSRHTGLRVSSVGSFTRDDIETLLDGGVVNIEERKNGFKRSVFFSEQCIKEFKRFSNGLDVVFNTQQTLAGTPHQRNWDRFINSTLHRVGKEKGVNITSYSLRLTFLAEILVNLSMEELAKILKLSEYSLQLQIQIGNDLLTKFLGDHERQTQKI